MCHACASCNMHVHSCRCCLYIAERDNWVTTSYHEGVYDSKISTVVRIPYFDSAMWGAWMKWIYECKCVCMHTISCTVEQMNNHFLVAVISLIISLIYS